MEKGGGRERKGGTKDESAENQGCAAGAFGKISTGTNHSGVQGFSL